MSSFDGYNSNGWRGGSDSGEGVGGWTGWGVAIKQEATQHQPIIMPLSPAYSRGLTRGAKSGLGTVRFRRKTSLLHRKLVNIERDYIIKMQQIKTIIELHYINSERQIQQMQAANHMTYLQGAMQLQQMQASSQAFQLQRQGLAHQQMQQQMQ